MKHFKANTIEPMIPRQKILLTIAVTLVILIGVYNSATSIRCPQLQQQETPHLKGFQLLFSGNIIQINQAKSALLESKQNICANLGYQINLECLAFKNSYDNLLPHTLIGTASLKVTNHPSYLNLLLKNISNQGDKTNNLILFLLELSLVCISVYFL